MVSSRTVTLSALRTRARQRSDMENSTFVSDAEFNAYINTAADELYDMLIQAYGPEYWIKETTINTTSGTTVYDLPDDFYKLIGVDGTHGGRQYSMVPYQWEQRNLYNEPNLQYAYTRARYRLTGANTDSGNSRIEILPDAAETNPVTVHYIPFRSLLEDDGDTLNGFNGWEEYIVISAARKALLKEESEVRPLNTELAIFEGRLETMRRDRDISGVERIVDYEDHFKDWWY